jgi:hypothetical protein
LLLLLLLLLLKKRRRRRTVSARRWPVLRATTRDRRCDEDDEDVAYRLL